MDKKILAIAAIVSVIVVAFIAINATGIFLPNGDEVNDVPDVPDDEVNDVPDVPDDEPNGVPDGEFSPVESLQFNVKETYDYEIEEVTMTETVEVTLSAKDIGTITQKIMSEGTINGDGIGFIINAELRKLWGLIDGEWVEVPDEEWDMASEHYENIFYSYYGALGTTGFEEYNYVDSDRGIEVRIYDIQKNPTLDDSMFVA